MQGELAVLAGSVAHVYRRGAFFAVSAASHVYRRGLVTLGQDTPEYEVPSWTPLVILFDILLFLPLWIFIGYTMRAVFPVLAMVEDENPPSYQSLATNPPADADAESTTGEAGPLPTKTDGSPRAVTSSLRLTQRLIRSQGGPRAYLRGLPVLLFHTAGVSMLSGIFAVLPRPINIVGVLIGNLAMVQFSAAWVHTVLTPRSPLPFWRRLPEFKRTFNATAKPTALLWLASTVGSIIPLLAIYLLKFDLPEDPKNVDPALAWKSLLVCLSALVQIFLIIPAQVILVRTQASLLPEDQETIIPFDRSFQGTVEPTIVSGKGYPSIKEAWATFSRPAWRRLVILYAKLAGVSIAMWIFMALVIIPEVILIVANSTEKKN